MTPSSTLGTFETDEADRISAAKVVNGVITVTVEWKARVNGFRPLSQTFTNDKVKEQCPRLLVDFYESRINLKK